MAKTCLASVRTDLIQFRKNGLRWREVGIHYPGVPLGTLCRIAHDEAYEPKSKKLRRALGLSPRFSPHPVIRLHALKVLLRSPYNNS